jgi:hypothetical protein
MARNDAFYQGLLTRFGIQENSDVDLLNNIGYQYDPPVTLTPGVPVGGVTQNFLQELNIPGRYFQVIGPASRNRYVEITLREKGTNQRIQFPLGITERMIINNIRPYPAQIPLPAPYLAPAAAAAAGGNKRRKTKKLKKNKRKTHKRSSK